MQIMADSLTSVSANILRLCSDQMAQIERDNPIQTQVQEIDEEFGVINEFDVSVTLSEMVFGNISDEVRNFREKVVRVEKSFRRRTELIDTLITWQRDPENRFAILWIEHFQTIALIISLRSKGVYIPNSILIEYLVFFADCIVNSNSKSPIFRTILNKSVGILLKLIAKATSSDIIQLYLSRIFPHLGDEHRLLIFQSCHSIIKFVGDEIVVLKEPARKRILLHVFKIYLLVLRFFDISLEELKSFCHSFKPQAVMVPFIDLVLLYRIFALLPTVNRNLIKTFVLKCHGPFYKYTNFLNFLLKETEFTQVDVIVHKQEIFKRIREIFFDSHNLFDILLFCLDNDLNVIYEALLIYSEKDFELFDTLLKLLRHIMVERKHYCNISVYASIVATFPEITVGCLDQFLISYLDDPESGKRKINGYMLKSFRMLILAAESINSSSTWNMSNAFLEHLKSVQFDSKHAHLLQAGRIYLQVRFGIPFSLTAVTDDVHEEVSWIEVIGFVNLILEKEARQVGLEKVPKIRTDELLYSE